MRSVVSIFVRRFLIIRIQYCSKVSHNTAHCFFSCETADISSSYCACVCVWVVSIFVSSMSDLLHTEIIIFVE